MYMRIAIGRARNIDKIDNEDYRTLYYDCRCWFGDLSRDHCLFVRVTNWDDFRVRIHNIFSIQGYRNYIHE